MGKVTTIAWTHHTFNGWWGCTRVSPGCEHCYAEEWAGRFGFGWGVKADRRLFGDKHWNEPLAWDRAAAAAGERRRVFCSSMSDVFEDRPELVEQRARLWRLILATPHLDWLLLTKRPENVERMLPWPPGGKPWANVWIGTTAEDQEWADKRLDVLAEVNAVVRFVSVEPQLGPVDLRKWLAIDRERGNPAWIRSGWMPDIDWVIVGGESGDHARPFHVEWADLIVEQCVAAGVAAFVKQLGDRPLGRDGADLIPIRTLAKKGTDPAEFPERLRVRKFPVARAA